MNRRYVVSKKDAQLFSGFYDNGAKKAPLLLNTVRQHPKSIRQVQSEGMRKVPVTLAQIPESRVLTKEELK